MSEDYDAGCMEYCESLCEGMLPEEPEEAGNSRRDFIKAIPLLAVPFLAGEAEAGYTDPCDSCEIVNQKSYTYFCEHVCQTYCVYACEIGGQTWETMCFPACQINQQFGCYATCQSICQC